MITSQPKSKIGRLVNLGSSSKGNSFYIELLSNGLTKPLNILLEVGFEFNNLLKMMTKNNVNLNEIDLVLVTHKHSDHSESVKEFVKRGIPVYAPQSVFEHYGVFWNEKFLMKAYDWKEIAKGITILPIPLEHFDKGERVETFGYIFDIDNEFSMLFATDTKYIPQDLSKFKFDVIFLEANYLEDTVKYALLEAEKDKHMGNISRYARLVDSHMSLENMVQTLDGSIGNLSKPFDLSNTKLLFLIHLSSNKQTNEQYYKMFTINYLQRKFVLRRDFQVIVCKREGGFL